MPVVTIFSGAFCKGEELSTLVAEAMGCDRFTESAIIARASAMRGVAPDKFERVIHSKTSVFNRFTHERERYVAAFKLVLAEMLTEGDRVFFGYSGHLIPQSVTHVLKACVIADKAFRIRQAVETGALTEARASKAIDMDDSRRADWTEYLMRAQPWNPSLYDIVLPMDKTKMEEAVALIIANLKKPVLRVTDASRKAMADFVLTAKVEMALANEGHAVTVDSDDGVVRLTINKHVILLSHLEDELKKIVGRVEGVRAVDTRVGPDFYQTDIYRKFDFETPSKVLLVDDEKEFVQTLSERLLMRDVGSAVTYDGEQALSILEEDEPEVMILDLKMPGIDGIEVLRRVKETHPNVEVIILTGHGTKVDQEQCEKLGAFAYLRKPVDIDLLTQTMTAAYDKIKIRRENEGDDDD
jgi:CheY-like chemotaxis protein